METFQNAINVNGLSDDIFSALIQNAQRKVIDKVMNAAQNGQTSCVVKNKGLTPSFLSQLEQEGVSNVSKEDEDCTLLFWEW